MRPDDDHGIEMAYTGLSDGHMEALIRGETPEDPGLAALVPTIESLRVHANSAPDEARLGRLATEAARLAREAEPSRPAETGREPARRWKVPRYAGAMAALALLMGMTGVAVAATEAAPGDNLYWAKLALERVGFVAGGAEERLSEASILAERGRLGDALSHAAEALSEHELEGAEALVAATERLRRLQEDHAQPERAEEVLAHVTAMLQWMSEVDHRAGPEFGQEVAEWARGIGGPPEEPRSQGQGQERSQGQGQGHGQGGSGNNR